MKKYTHKHEGHRQRLKDKIRENGLSVLQEHEILEWLLMYTIPYKDTNALAHDLIDRFGSLSNVLDTNRLDLTSVKGVGEETALFLSSLPEMINYYKNNRKQKTDLIRSTANCKQYFRQNFEIQKEEHFYIICLNSVYKVLAKYDYKGENSCKVDFDLKNLTSIISAKDISSIVLFHTHPNGEVEPSLADMNTTRDVLNICAIMHVRLCDHIIFNETDCYSFGEHGVIDKMYYEFLEKFPEQRKNIPSIAQLVGFNYEEK